ncbi:MAG: tetratricopeptide repeat protein [Bacteroidales bacterium]|nr:tetratricopeptide repeat protein [Bacteroidales bacterium]
MEAIKQKLFGNGADALEYLEQCIKLNPKSDAVYYQMAQILINKGDLNNSKKFISKAISINDRNIWYLMMLANIYYQESDIDSAVICYEKAVQYFPDKADIKLILGNLYSENKNFNKAESIFDSFDEKYGVNENSTISAIKNLMSAEKYDKALIKAKLLLKESPDEIVYNGLMAEIYRGMGENNKAKEVYEKLIERNPNNPQIQLSLCDFLITQKNYNELFSLLNTILISNSVTREDKIALIVHMSETEDIVKTNSEKLLISIMVLEANYKDDDIIVLLRPDLLIKQNKLIEAKVRLEEIIKSRKENYYAWEKLLLLYLQLHDYDNLMSKGEECATLFNRSFLAKILYANGAMEKEKYSIALDELSKAEILAGDKKEYMIQVLTMQADVYYRMKDFSKAFEVFDKAVKYDDNDLTVLNNYAYYLAEQNIKLKEAEEMSRKVIEKEKGNSTYLDTYGWVLYKRGKLNEAAKVMEEIIGSGKKPDAEWYEHYGFILKKQKKCSKAIENWNIAIKLDSKKSYLIKEIENCRK